MIRITGLAFSPDGRSFAAVDDFKTGRVWDMQNLAAPIVLRGHEEAIIALAFAPDGRLITAGYDMTARIRDLKKPDSPQFILRGHSQRINRLVLASKRWLATSNGDSTAMVWSLDLGSLNEMARRIASRNLTLEERQYYSGIEAPYHGTLDGLPDGRSAGK